MALKTQDNINNCTSFVYFNRKKMQVWEDNEARTHTDIVKESQRN